MKFGVFDHMDESGLPLGEQYESRLQLVEAYDRGGFYAYHLAEHHETPLGCAPSPSLFLAAAAQRTKKLRFGPLVYLLPLYHPLRLIEEICMLDQGQAFRLEGGSFLEAPWTGAYQFGRQDATLTLYVQFASLHGEQVLFSRRSKSGAAAGMTLLKSNDNRLVFLTAMPGGKPHKLQSAIVVRAGVWYHVAITRNEQQAVLYLVGVAEDTRAFKAAHPRAEGTETPLYLASDGHAENSLNGLLDEVAFYRRALSAQEVQALFQLRETGPCRP